MSTRARIWVVALLVVAATAVGLAGGASNSAASTTEECTTEGRLFCTSITDLDRRSLSTASTHYMKYSVTVRNNGGAKLTNGTLRLTLTDIIGLEDVDPDDPQDPDDIPSTAVYQDAVSDGRCSVVGSTTNVLDCLVPSPLAVNGTVTYATLIFATSTVAGATATKMQAVAAFKERASDKPPVDPNPETAGVSELTTYEADPDEDVSWAFPTASITLETSRAGAQYSTFPLPTVPAGTEPFTASLKEFNVGSAPAGLNPCATTCYGQIVQTTAGGLTPFELLITLNFVPYGGFENSGIVYHKPDIGPVEVITDSCDTAIPPDQDPPCRDIDVDHLPGGEVIVTIRVLSAGNGSVGIG